MPRDQARFELLLGVLDELRDANADAPVLVEGLRDVASLRALGCTGELVPLNQGKTLYEVCEELARRAPLVILLTDWDRKGGYLRAETTRAIEGSAARVDATFRDRIRLYVDEPVKDVESLAGYVRRGLEKFFLESLEDHLQRVRGHHHVNDPSENMKS